MHNLDSLDWTDICDGNASYHKALIPADGEGRVALVVVTDAFLDPDWPEAELVIWTTTTGDLAAHSADEATWPLLDELFGCEHWRDFLSRRSGELRASRLT